MNQQEARFGSDCGYLGPPTRAFNGANAQHHFNLKWSYFRPSAGLGRHPRRLQHECQGLFRTLRLGRGDRPDQMVIILQFASLAYRCLDWLQGLREESTLTGKPPGN